MALFFTSHSRRLRVPLLPLFHPLHSLYAQDHINLAQVETTRTTRARVSHATALANHHHPAPSLAPPTTVETDPEVFSKCPAPAPYSLISPYSFLSPGTIPASVVIAAVRVRQRPGTKGRGGGRGRGRGRGRASKAITGKRKETSPAPSLSQGGGRSGGRGGGEDGAVAPVVAAAVPVVAVAEIAPNPTTKDLV